MSVSLNNLTDQESLLLTQISEFADELTDECKGKNLDYLLKHADSLGFSDAFKNRLIECCSTSLKYLVIKNFAHPDGLKTIAFWDSFGNTGFSFFGTDSDNVLDMVVDIIDDGISVVEGTSQEIRWAIDFFLFNKGDGDSNYLFGHSHGAAICEAILLIFNAYVKQVILLNPQYLGGITGLTEDLLGILKGGKVKVIANEGDLLTGLESKIESIYNRYGESNVRIIGNFGKPCILNYHAYGNVGFNNDGSCISNTQIKVDYKKLRECGKRLEHVQNRYIELERKIRSHKDPSDSHDTELLEIVGNIIDSITKIFGGVINTLSSNNITTELGNCCSAIFKAAEEFEAFENLMNSLKNNL